MDGKIRRSVGEGRDEGRRGQKQEELGEIRKGCRMKKKQRKKQEN